jgi:glycosyltransferase involved in cell wall biosynthesis
MNDNGAIRILHVRTVRGTGGGPDKTTLNGCRHLRQSGHIAEAFYILDRREDTGRLQQWARDLGVTMHVAHESWPLSLRTVWSLRNVLDRGDYDIVHTHEYKSNALVRLLRGRRRHRVVATAHGYNRTTFREGFYYALEWRIFRGVDAIIAPTRKMADFLVGKGVREEKIHVIHNGIEVAGRQRPAPVPGEGALRLLYLGRLSPEKDPANLLAAIGLLRSRGLALRATLAGDGPERAALEQQVRALGLSEVVELPGFVPDIMPLLAKADILVNPSRTEGMPNAVLEAMWAGVTVCATGVGGVPEMIRDGVDGLLCPPRDPQALADKIAKLAGDANLRKQMTDRAYDRVTSEFSFERRMERVLDLYRRVLGGSQRERT